MFDFAMVSSNILCGVLVNRRRDWWCSGSNLVWALPHDLACTSNPTLSVNPVGLDREGTPMVKLQEVEESSRVSRSCTSNPTLSVIPPRVFSFTFYSLGSKKARARHMPWFLE